MDIINPMEWFVDYSQGMTFSNAVKKVEENSSTPDGQLKELILRVAVEIRRRNLDDPNCPLWHPEGVRLGSSPTGYSLYVSYRPESDYLTFFEDVFYKSHEPSQTWEYVGTLKVHKQILARSVVVSRDFA